MAESDCDIADTESEDDYEIYGVADEPKIHLPNFIDAGDVDTQWVIETIDANYPSELNYRGYVPNGRFKFGFNEIELCIIVNSQSAPTSFTSHVENTKLSRKVVDSIRWSLRESIAHEIATSEYEMNTRISGLVVLRLLEETTAYIQGYRHAQASGNCQNKTSKLLNSWRRSEDLNLNTAQSTATQILGKTPFQIVGEELEGWRVLHIENVLRKDLRNKFYGYQAQLRQKLMNLSHDDLRPHVPKEYRRVGGGHLAAKEQLVEYLVKPRITFHGTRRDKVASIVENGFLKPGDKNPITGKKIQRANGLTYGLGVYSSPEPWFCLYYSNRGERHEPSELPGIKIIVCAIIMGRVAQILDCSFRGETEPVEGTDSHVSYNGLEWVAFNSAQILPCYVLHLDWAGSSEDDIYDFVSKKAAESKSKHKKLSNQVLFPGEKKRQKEERLAKARKFFAYGFGPVSGKNIVIEEIADIDDDEEDYGEYQGNRMESYQVEFSLEEEDTLDQYKDSRKASVRRPKLGEIS